MQTKPQKYTITGGNLSFHARVWVPILRAQQPHITHHTLSDTSSTLLCHRQMCQERRTKKRRAKPQHISCRVVLPGFLDPVIAIILDFCFEALCLQAPLFFFVQHI